MENVEKTGYYKYGSRVKDVKVYFGTLDNAKRAGGIFDDTIHGSDENKTAAEVKNDDPAFPGHCDNSALTCWVLEDASVGDM